MNRKFGPLSLNVKKRRLDKELGQGRKKILGKKENGRGRPTGHSAKANEKRNQKYKAMRIGSVE